MNITKTTKIVNPFTNKKISIFSKKGKLILKNYIKYLFKGGSKKEEVVPLHSRIAAITKIQAFAKRFQSDTDRNIRKRCVREIDELNLSVYHPVDGARTIVLGDIHGDLEALKHSLRYCANVIDENDDWVGENTYVVLAGDMIDRARRQNNRDWKFITSIVDKQGRGVGEVKDEEIKIQKFLNRLALQANATQGRIIKLLGNHEIMYINQDISGADSEWVSRYSTNFGLRNEAGADRTVDRILSDGNYNQQMYDGYIYPTRELEDSGKNRLANYASGASSSRLIMDCGGRMIVKIGDWIIVHGGILPKLIKKIYEQLGIAKQANRGRLFLEKANELLKKKYNNNLDETCRHDVLFCQHCGTYPSYLSGEKRVYDNYTNNEGLVWIRKLAGISKFQESDCRFIVPKIFSLLGFPNARIVVAHCPQKEYGVFSDEIDIYQSSGITYNLLPTGHNSTATIFGPSNTYNGTHCDYRGNSANLNDKCPKIPGITYQCPDRNGIGKIWRIDVAMSRSFDILGEMLKSLDEGKIKDYWNARKPQVLEVIHRNYVPDEVRVYRSKHHLPRDDEMFEKYMNNANVKKFIPGTENPNNYTWKNNIKPGNNDIPLMGQCECDNDCESGHCNNDICV